MSLISIYLLFFFSLFCGNVKTGIRIKVKRTHIHTVCGTLNMLRLSSENRISIEFVQLKSMIWHFGHFGCIFFTFCFIFRSRFEFVSCEFYTFSKFTSNAIELPYIFFLLRIMVSLDKFNCVVRIYLSNRIKWTY